MFEREKDVIGERKAKESKDFSLVRDCPVYHHF